MPAMKLEPLAARGHRCSCCCRLGVFRRTLGSRTNAQMDAVIAGFVGCLGSDLAAAHLLAPFHLPLPSPARSPSTMSMPYLLPCPSNALRPSPALSLSLSLSPCVSSSSLPLLNAHSRAMLADGTRSRILHFVRGRFRVQNQRTWAIGLMSMPGMLGRGIGGNGTSLEVMDGRASSL